MDYRELEDRLTDTNFRGRGISAALSSLHNQIRSNPDLMIVPYDLISDHIGHTYKAPKRTLTYSGGSKHSCAHYGQETYIMSGGDYTEAKTQAETLGIRVESGYLVSIPKPGYRDDMRYDPELRKWIVKKSYKIDNRHGVKAWIDQNDKPITIKGITAQLATIPGRGIRWIVSIGDRSTHEVSGVTLDRSKDARGAIRRAIKEIQKQKKADRLAEQKRKDAEYRASHLYWVTIEDARKAGNCSIGIQSFLNRAGIDPNTIGAIRSDLLMELGEKFNLRSFVTRSIAVSDHVAS